MKCANCENYQKFIIPYVEDNVFYYGSCDAAEGGKISWLSLMKNPEKEIQCSLFKARLQNNVKDR